MKVAVRVEFTLEADDVITAIELVERAIESAARPRSLIEVRTVSAVPVAPVVHERVVTEELDTEDRAG